MATAVRAVAEAHPTWAIIKNDGDNAYYRAKRMAAISEAEILDTALADFVRLWYQGPSEFVWFDTRGRPHWVCNVNGFGQGGPGAPWIYPLGVHQALHQAKRRIQEYIITELGGAPLAPHPLDPPGDGGFNEGRGRFAWTLEVDSLPWDSLSFIAEEDIYSYPGHH